MQNNEGVTLVTGASGGLGIGIVEQLIKQGRTNIACQYNSNSDRILAVLEEAGLSPDLHLFQADLAQEASVSDLRREIEARLGQVTELVNLAGGSSNSMSWKLGLDDFNRIMTINMTSTFLCCREFSPSMRASGYGRIINTSSIVAFKGAVGASHYAAAKAAVIGYSKSLAQELANKAVTVNVLALGYMDTGIIDQVPKQIQDDLIDQTPLKRLGSPKDAAECLQYLLGEGGGFVTGQVFHINGGLYI